MKNKIRPQRKIQNKRQKKLNRKMPNKKLLRNNQLKAITIIETKNHLNMII